MNAPSDTYEFEAIGTHWWLERLDGGKFSKSIRDALADYTAEFDRRYSRFREDSLVIQLAREGVLKNPPAEMLVMLDYAKKLCEASEGAFSLLVGNTLASLGYGRLAGLNPAKRDKHKGCVDGVRWNSGEVRVAKGTVLDFGGLGKGWLIDEYARILREKGVKEFVVNGGGDLYVESSKPISFALEHPYDPSLKIGDIQLKTGALAASSTLKRVWKDVTGAHHHIIDPVTDEPSDGDVVATFVQAESALIADSLATILILRPQLKDMLSKKYKAKAIVVNRQNSIR